MAMTARELMDILYAVAVNSDTDLEELYVTVDCG